MIPILQPKQVKCVKGSFSFKTNDICKVDEEGYILFKNGSKSGRRWDETNGGNAVFEFIYTDEELRDFAKKMYPIGTKYKTASKANNDIVKVLSKHIITSNGNIHAGPGYIYYKETNTWAEIISEQTEVKLEAPLEKCKRLFTLGKTVLSTFDTQFIVKTDHLPFSAYPGGNIFTKGGDYCLYEAEEGKYATILEEDFVESFAVKCPEDYASNEVWKKYISWLNKKFNANTLGVAVGYYYGIDKSGAFVTNDRPDRYNEIKKLEHLYDLLCIMKPLIKLKRQLEVGDWIKLIDKPTDGSIPPNWADEMNEFYGTWQQVIKFDYNNDKPHISASNVVGNWTIEHCNYTDVKTNEEYNKTNNDILSASVLADIVSKNLCSEISMPKTDTKNIKVGDWILINTYFKNNFPWYWNQKGAMNHLCGTWQQVALIDNFIRIKSDNVSVSKDYWSFKIEDVISYCTDEEYKRANKLCDTSVTNHTFQPLEDAHNRSYDQLIAERQKFVNEVMSKPKWVSRPLTPEECYPSTPDGWIPVNTFTKSAANLVATKPVKVTGYKYVNLKNK
jgi:hypothetical protein